ncbi:MAG: phosphoenolpyruvate carboxykinase [Patescibacteria group bacterium]|nr:phosphoenolpyruvate carboxykinase [Patescibacteria group bacterium]
MIIQENTRSIETVLAPKIHTDLPPLALQGAALDRKENGARLTLAGVLAVTTEPTGRSPKSKGLVESNYTEAFDLGGANRPVTEHDFRGLLQSQVDHLRTQEDIYKNNYFIRTDVGVVSPVKIVTSSAWGAMFSGNLFLRRETVEALGDEIDQSLRVTIVHTPEMKTHIPLGGNPADNNIAVVTEFSPDGEHTVAIAGTEYGGEIKKSVFGIANTELPLRDIATMHCSANEGEKGDVALFFGLSGTGKTTLSTDPERKLIGDDEHGWSSKGVFNFEGGSYAKVTGLRESSEPHIYRATRMSGSILENVALNTDGSVDYENSHDNSRAAYPIDYLPFAKREGSGTHPERILFLTADASGVLPAVARLSPEQAIYHYLSGYTSKIPGTEAGVIRPEATFSACFGEPFLTHAPEVYARLLEEKIAEHAPQLWLVNTGWTGGFEDGERISIEETRKIVAAIHSGELEEMMNVASFRHSDALGFTVPSFIQGVSHRVLNPERNFSSESAYLNKAYELSEGFKTNFARYASVPERIRSAGPQIR